MGSESFPGNFKGREPPSDLQEYLAAAFSPEKQRAELEEEGSTFFIAEVEGAPVGFARLRAAVAPGITPPVELELERLYVLPNATNGGVGSELMKACVKEAARRGATALWLGVWSENPDAIRFYRSHGFIEAGTKEFELGEERHGDLVLVRAVP